MYKLALSADEKNIIDSKKPVLIGEVKKIFSTSNMRDPRNIPDKRQYSGLVQAAEHAACVEELTLLIRYKSVKEGSKTGWKHMADPLAKALEDLKKHAGEIAASLNGDISKYHLELARLFLGYLMWEGCSRKAGI